jgi:hypothetical protein
MNLRRHLMKLFQVATLLALATLPSVQGIAGPAPSRFGSNGQDLKAINALLANYTRAVSNRDQALFESLLLDRSIPFSGVPATGKAGSDRETRNYESFRKGVFEGEPFTQKFRDVHIEQDGALANVTLVFENTQPAGKSWGWKILQLLKVDGDWKIASEFYTAHPAK